MELIDVIDELISISNSTKKARVLTDILYANYFSVDYSMAKSRSKEVENGILLGFKNYSICSDIIFDYILQADEKINRLIDVLDTNH